MGESQENPLEEIISSQTMFGLPFAPDVEANPLPVLGWINRVDAIISENAECPYSAKAAEITSSMRRTLKEFDVAWTAKLRRERLPIWEYDSQRTIKEEEDDYDRLLMSITQDEASIAHFLQMMWQWKQGKSAAPKVVKQGLPLKYKEGTFSYSNKSVDAPRKGNMALFCHYFYSNCTASGKMPLNEALEKMRQDVPSATELDLRQWISDLNRWAQRATTFRSQLGPKGKLLRVRDKQIERLK